MATIQTKFNVGDKLFTIDKESMKIKEFEVSMVCAFIHYSDAAPTVSYQAKGSDFSGKSVDEEKCFKTKHELLTYIEQPESEE